jgi:hypothetical protein
VVHPAGEQPKANEVVGVFYHGRDAHKWPAPNEWSGRNFSAARLRAAVLIRSDQGGGAATEVSA